MNERMRLVLNTHEKVRTLGKLTNDILKELIDIVGIENIITDVSSMEDFSHDEMPPDIAIKCMPDVVVKPKDSKQVSQILKLANKNLIPVTPRGAGTGLSGGAVPIYGGIVLSLERMNRIVDIDEDNLMIVVEAGVPMMNIFKVLDETDMFFPPHPGDESAHIGATIATNAGGARTVKYGVMRNYVKGAEVILPNGEIFNLGGKLLKNNTGYNILQLLIGSEGTLGIFTKVILRLLPKPKQSIVLLLQYEDIDSAISTIPDILKSGEIPIGLEYLERECITPTEKLTGDIWPAKGNAFLMVALIGRSEDELYSICEEISLIGEKKGASDVILADKKRDQERILNIRSNIYEGLKPETLEILDIGVPPSMIPRLVKKTKEIGSKNDVLLPVYGHAADGNMHIHILKTGLGEGWKTEYAHVKKELFEECERLGGVITAEHGVGAQKIKDLHYSLDKKEVELMKNIKRMFDPNNILNPGKVIPIKK